MEFITSQFEHNQTRIFWKLRKHEIDPSDISYATGHGAFPASFSGWGLSAYENRHGLL
jgi:hypothetical protein